MHSSISNVTIPVNSIRSIQEGRHFHTFRLPCSEHLLISNIKIGEDNTENDVLKANQQQIPQNQIIIRSNLKNSIASGMNINRRHILDRALVKVKQLSLSNRLNSSSSIKAEQLYFRLKLKMLALLRRINFKAEQIEQLQLLEPEQLIHPLTTKLTKFFKEQQKKQKSLSQKSTALCLALKLKNEQILALKKWHENKLQQQNSHINKLSQQLREVRARNFEKQKEVDGLKLQITAVHTKFEEITETLQIKEFQLNSLRKKVEDVIHQCQKQNQLVHSLTASLKFKQHQNANLFNKYLQLSNEHKKMMSPPTFSITSSFSSSLDLNRLQTQSIYTQTQNYWLSCQSNPECIDNQFSIEEEAQNMSETSSIKINENNGSVLRVAEIISIWKSRMYETVNYYEWKMEQYRRNVKQKQQLISSLQMLFKQLHIQHPTLNYPN